MEMKTITFRPLRRIKKTGKIVVASYPQWRQLVSADREKFNLVIDTEYKMLPKDEFVHDHTGEILFWKNYQPADIPIVQKVRGIDIDFDGLMDEYGCYGIVWDIYNSRSFNAPGLDCSGVPLFTHMNTDYVAQYKDVNQFDPLTVDTVITWFGWFLLQLNNAYLQFGK